MNSNSRPTSISFDGSEGDCSASISISTNPKEPDSSDKDESKAASEPEVRLLMLPVEMREKIYTFLTGADFKNLRLVCDTLRYEAEVFGYFNVTLPHRPVCLNTQIPFTRIHTLAIDNDTDVLPWGDCPTDIVHNIVLTKVCFKTLQHLGELRSPQHATLRSNVFHRPIPALAWSNLRSLRVKFYVPPDRAEEFMLDNLDTLLEQKFDSLKSLSISMVNAVTPNLQSQYSVRVARFSAKHYLTLKDLHLTMEARRCVRRNYVMPAGGLKSGLSKEELQNFGKVQLNTLELNVSEISCPRCSIWKAFIQQQNQLQSLYVNVSGAEKLSSNFFCNPKKMDQFCSLEVLVIRLWGLAGYYPLDFRYLKCASKLSFMELGRYPEGRSQLTRPELLNVECIPKDIQTLNISGFLIASDDVVTMLTNLEDIAHFTLLDCGSGLDIGVTMAHVPHLSALPCLVSGMLDFNTADPSPDRSQRLVANQLKQFMRPVSMDWRYLYDIGFHQCHRFEFARVYYLESPPFSAIDLPFGCQVFPRRGIYGYNYSSGDATDNNNTSTETHA